MSIPSIPSRVHKSERSGFYVATVYGPAPYGGSLTLAHETEEEAWAWVSEQEARR